MTSFPILKPIHFKGLSAGMINHGIAFKASLSFDDWSFHAPQMDAWDEQEKRLRGLAARREPGRVLLNPRAPPISAIQSLCRQSQAKHCPREEFNVDYGLPHRVDRKWKRIPDRALRSEGQKLVLVAFDGQEKFAGYASLDANLNGLDQSWSLDFTLHLVYVLPERRRLGFGLDLSVATGILCQDILRASYRAVPSGSTLTPSISADYASAAGEVFTLNLRDELDFAVDMLKEDHRRPSITLSYAELAAGY